MLEGVRRRGQSLAAVARSMGSGSIGSIKRALASTFIGLPPSSPKHALKLPTTRRDYNVVQKQRRRRNYVRNQHIDRLPGQDDITSGTGPHTNPGRNLDARACSAPRNCSSVSGNTRLSAHPRRGGRVRRLSPDGMKMFGVLDLETEMHGCRFAIGLRNSHDKSMRLALTCGYKLS